MRGDLKNPETKRMMARVATGAPFTTADLARICVEAGVFPGRASTNASQFIARQKKRGTIVAIRETTSGYVWQAATHAPSSRSRA